VTVVIDQQVEITHANNTATAWIGGASPELPPPMLTAVEPSTVAAGGQVTIEARSSAPGTIALAGEAPTALFTVTFVDAEQLKLEVDAATPPGTYLISVAGPDGKRSNLLPLTVTD
jgi:hypothetical protein